MLTQLQCSGTATMSFGIMMMRQDAHNAASINVGLYKPLSLSLSFLSSLSLCCNKAIPTLPHSSACHGPAPLGCAAGATRSKQGSLLRGALKSGIQQGPSYSCASP